MLLDRLRTRGFHICCDYELGAAVFFRQSKHFRDREGFIHFDSLADQLIGQRMRRTRGEEDDLHPLFAKNELQPVVQLYFVGSPLLRRKGANRLLRLNNLLS